MDDFSKNNSLQNLLDYYDQKNFEKVISKCKKLTLLNNKSYILHSLMGASYEALNCYNEAILSYKESLKINNKVFETYFNLGNIYLKKFEYNNAIKNYKKALLLNKTYSVAYNNLGIAYLESNDLKNAEKTFKNLIKIDPDFSQGICNLATVFLQNNNYLKALKFYELAMKSKPSIEERIEIQKNLSLCQLKTENFSEGWKNYKSRLNSIDYITLSNIPFFNFETNYKEIIILPEQGIGDEIFFSRFFNDLKKINKNFHYLCSEKLSLLFKNSFPNINFIDKEKFIEDINFQKHCLSKYRFDSQIHIGDLASFFIFDSKDIVSRSQKFLYTHELITRKIDGILPKDKIICGLSWISKNKSTAFAQNNKEHVSTSLINLKTLLNQKNFYFLDLNYVDTFDQRTKFYNDYGIKIEKFNQIDNLNNLNELSSLINNCDFVISVSNTTAHLSAGLGKKTFLLLPNKNKKIWYWNSNFGQSNWYNSMKIYENFKEKDLKELIKILNNE